MNRRIHPLPTATELTSAILILSRTFQTLRIKHGLIDSSAIFLHAKAFSLPCLLPSRITILIQPSSIRSISELELTHALSEKQYASEYRVTRKNGIDYTEVIIKRPKEDLRGDLLVDFQILDHWTSHEKREAYDFRLPGNETVPIMIGGEQVHVLNPEWLLCQKIQMWNQLVQDREKRMNERDIRTLVDILGFRGVGKIRLRRRREIEELRKVVLGMNGDDPGVLGSVIDCPEVFGPWWDLQWVRALGAVGVVLVLMKALDMFRPD